MTLAVRALVAPGSTLPPVVLVHGSANSAGVWTLWQEELARRGWSSWAIDLRGHGGSAPTDLSKTRMRDYAADVVDVRRTLRDAPVLMGWSMGGLVAMMAAAACGARACVGLAPSAPAARRDESVTVREGVFGPEEYGIRDRNPEHQPAMPDLDREERRVALASLGAESRLARDERAAGVVVEPLGCPLLVVTGGADTQWPAARYRSLPVPAEVVSVDGASHWGLVLGRTRVVATAAIVNAWLEKALA